MQKDSPLGNQTELSSSTRATYQLLQKWNSNSEVCVESMQDAKAFPHCTYIVHHWGWLITVCPSFPCALLSFLRTPNAMDTFSFAAHYSPQCFVLSSCHALPHHLETGQNEQALSRSPDTKEI